MTEPALSPKRHITNSVNGLSTDKFRPGHQSTRARSAVKSGSAGLQCGRRLRRLESEQLVAIYPRRGIFATDINITDHALLRMSAVISRGWRRSRGLNAPRPKTVGRWATFATVSRILTCRLEDFMGLDREVHSALYRSTGNCYLEKTLGQYYNLASRIWTAFLSRIDVAEHLANHRALLDAVLKGDGKNRVISLWRTSTSSRRPYSASSSKSWAACGCPPQTIENELEAHLGQPGGAADDRSVRRAQA